MAGTSRKAPWPKNTYHQTCKWHYSVSFIVISKHQLGNSQIAMLVGCLPRGAIPLLVLTWPSFSCAQFSLSEFNQGGRIMSMHCSSMDCRKTDLGKPGGPSSWISRPRRLETLLRCRMQVAHRFYLPSSSDV